MRFSTYESHAASPHTPLGPAPHSFAHRSFQQSLPLEAVSSGKRSKPWGLGMASVNAGKAYILRRPRNSTMPTKPVPSSTRDVGSGTVVAEDAT